MGLLDILLGGMLLYGLIKGLWRGLFVELASLLSLIIGIYVAIKFSCFLADMLVKEGDDSKYIAITAFVITFIAVVVGIILLAKVFTRIADFASLGLLNRILGGLFGFVKMVLILSVSLNFFLKMNSSNLFTKKETLDKSLFFNPLVKISNIIFPVLEDWFAEYREESLKPDAES